MELLNQLAKSDAAPDAKAEFRKMIEAVGLDHGVCLTSSTDRVEFARCLLDAGCARTEIRDRLMAKFEIRESQAYRDIREALDDRRRNERQTVPTG